jgi:uncharacterized protein
VAINFTGDFTVKAAPQRVFDFLSDPMKFAPCLPTYDSCQLKEDGHAEVVVRVGVGKIRGSAVIDLALTERSPPTRAAYSGKGKILGSAFNMDTFFELEDVEGGGTKVKWSGDLSMFGKLVALAGGLIRPIAKKDIEALIGALQTALEQGA